VTTDTDIYSYSSWFTGKVNVHATVTKKYRSIKMSPHMAPEMQSPCHKLQKKNLHEKITNFIPSEYETGIIPQLWKEGLLSFER
jgi:hypothetical protein